MKKIVVLFVCLTLNSPGFASTATLSDSERDTLLELVSESIFVSIALEKVALEEKNTRHHYQIVKDLFDKKAMSEMNMREAFWKWKKAENTVHALKAGLRVKELGVKIKESPLLPPKELEVIYKERWQARLDTAKAELARTENDLEYFKFAYEAHVKLHNGNATTKDKVLQYKNSMETALQEVPKMQAFISQIQKIISERQ